MDDLQPGRRVVVRYSLAPGDTHSTSDALGVVTAVDEAGLEIDTKRGPLRSAVDLRRISAAAWLPHDVSWLHVENLRNEGTEAAAEVSLLQKGWLLRHSESATRRANSCLPVTDTGLGWEQGLDAVEEWYRARGRPSRVQIYSADDSSTLAPECEGLAPLLSARGYTPSEATLLLSRVSSSPPMPSIPMDPEPWWRPAGWSSAANGLSSPTSSPVPICGDAVPDVRWPQPRQHCSLNAGSGPTLSTSSRAMRHRWVSSPLSAPQCVTGPGTPRHADRSAGRNPAG
ncbi:putative acetyltransferase, partial [Brevibacterium aurantiacum]|uniref:putative acetyltransferase n=1 Tax=Brevibacterium aurantiacum TaxID=273384 RepID=UPI00402AE8A6